MKHLITVGIVLLVCTATVIAGEEIAGRSFSNLPRTAAVPQFSPLGLEDSASSYHAIDRTAGGAIWIAGANSGATSFYGYRSINDGATWKKFTITMPTGAKNITNIAAKDSNVAVLGTDLGQIIRTTDGGATWTKVFEYIDNNAFMDAVKWVGTTRDTMLAFGDADTGGVFIARSVDAGATWKRIKTTLTDSVNESQFWYGFVTFGQAADAFGKNVWFPLYHAAGATVRILFTPDAGETWQVWPVALPGGASQAYYLRSINFLDAKNGWAVTRNSYGSTFWAVKTSDGGKTWSDTISVETGISHNDAKPCFVKPIRGTSSVFAGGFGTKGAKAWWSDDSGKTWTNMNIPNGPSANAEIENAVFINAARGFAIGTQIDLRLGPPTAVEERPNVLPGQYALSQNYPNPFNPATTIDYTLGRAGSVRLVVYDVLGRVVATLVDDTQSAGQHTVWFNASGLSSGVYYYTLRAGEFTATRSLILMK